MVGPLAGIPLAGDPFAQHQAVCGDVLRGHIQIAMDLAVLHSGIVGLLPLAVIAVGPVHPDGIHPGDLVFREGVIFVGGALAAQPDAQCHPLGGDVFDRHLEITVLEVIPGSGGVALLPELAHGIPDHPQFAQPLHPLRVEAVAEIPLPVVHDPLAQREAVLIPVAHRHHQVAVGVAVLFGRFPALLPRKREPLLPDHADLIQLGDLFFGQAAGAFARADFALDLQPATHGKPLRCDVIAGEFQVQLDTGAGFGRLIICVPALFQRLFQLPEADHALAQRIPLPERDGDATLLLDGFFVAAAGIQHGNDPLKGVGVIHQRNPAAGRHDPVDHQACDPGIAAFVQQDRPIDALLREHRIRLVPVRQQPHAGCSVGLKFCPRRAVHQRGISGHGVDAGRGSLVAQSDAQLGQAVPQPFLILRQHIEPPSLLGHGRDRLLCGFFRIADGIIEVVVELHQRVGQTGAVEVLDPGFQAAHHIPAGPEQSHQLGRHRHRSGGRGLVDRAARRHRILPEELLRTQAGARFDPHLPETQHPDIRAEADQPRHAAIPQIGGDRMVAVHDQPCGAALAQLHPLPGICRRQLFTGI